MNIFVVRILRTSCWRLIQPVKMYTNCYMMWYLKKDMFCREHIFFGWSVIFKTVCPSSVFFFGRSGRRPSSSGHIPRGTCLCICAHVNFYDHTRDRTSNCVHDRTNNLLGRSRVWTPGLAAQSFLWVQRSIPWPCSTIFLWVQGSIPGPNHLFSGP